MTVGKSQVPPVVGTGASDGGHEETASRARFAEIVEASADAIYSCDVDGFILTWNPGAERLYGYAAAESIGRDIAEFMPAERAHEFSTLLATIKNGEPLLDLETEGLKKDGSRVTVQLTVSPLTNGEAQVTALAVTARDLTERKLAELKVRESAIALRESEARFRAAVEAVDGIVWTNNALGEMTGEQPGWSALTGQTLAEYQGFGWSQAVHPDDAQPTIDAWNAAVAAKGLFEFEHRVRRRDGEWRHFSIRAAPIVDRGHRIVEWVGVHTDISAQKDAEAHRVFLMRELAHRSKNQLAVVQAIAGLTVRNAHSLEEFSKQFADRIQGLAVSTDILLAQRWDGAPLGELVTRQLQPFGTENGRLICEGPDIYLTPDAAQSIGLALHELATNCLKHGAWSLPTGLVRASWTVVPKEAQPSRLRITWIEQGGPPVSPPTRKGFGHNVIEKMTAQQLDGEVELTFAPQGLSWTLVVSAAHFLEGSGGVRGQPVDLLY